MINQRAALPVVLLVALASTPTGAEIIEQVLVNVNGDILTKTEFEQRQIAVLRTRPELGNVTPDSPELKRAIGEVTPQLILDAVDELLLIQRGRELGLALGDEQFNSIVENIRKSNNLEDEARFEAALEQEGMTMDDLRRSLERQMLTTEAQRRDVVDKISRDRGGSADLLRGSTANRSSRRRPRSRCARSSSKCPSAIEASTWPRMTPHGQEAEEIGKRLRAGEPFARLAGELSDAPSKANGGLIGPLSREELTEALQDPA